MQRLSRKMHRALARSYRCPCIVVESFFDLSVYPDPCDYACAQFPSVVSRGLEGAVAEEPFIWPKSGGPETHGTEAHHRTSVQVS